MEFMSNVLLCPLKFSVDLLKFSVGTDWRLSIF